MGLDMYLTANRKLQPETEKDLKVIEYLDSLALPQRVLLEDYSRYLYEFHDEDKLVIRTLESLGYSNVDTIRVNDKNWCLEISAGQWRKANQIHNWFVDNVQDGIDECQAAEVTKDDLMDLLDVVNQVIADPEMAPELLPTRSGFFFGGTDYDEYYFEDLVGTKAILDRIFSTQNFFEDYQVTYRSSW
jgi:hypothetical protein